EGRLSLRHVSSSLSLSLSLLICSLGIKKKKIKTLLHLLSKFLGFFSLSLLFDLSLNEVPKFSTSPRNLRCALVDMIRRRSSVIEKGEAKYVRPIDKNHTQPNFCV
ncbi:hypothetical protein QQP08_026912, partial [Theobroma cacao]